MLHFRFEAADPSGIIPASKNPGAVFGFAATQSDLRAQTFSTSGVATANLNVARNLVAQGQTPVLMLGGMLLDASQNLRPGARKTLSQAIIQYPDVFESGPIYIEAVDEPFWNTGALSSPAATAQAQQQILFEIQMIREMLPSAKIGAIVAPVWNIAPQIVAPLNALAKNLDWLGMDTYSATLDASGYQNSISLAQEFASYMKQNQPAVSTFLVLQGFAPQDGPPPSRWTTQQTTDFESYIATMFQIAKTQYNGAAVWGWGGVNELPDCAAGRHFPAAIQRFYAGQTAGF